MSGDQEGRQQIQVDPGQRLDVTLTFAEWRMVLGQLAEGPFKTVMPLIAAIEQQCNDELYRYQNRLSNGTGVANADDLHPQPRA